MPAENSQGGLYRSVLCRGRHLPCEAKLSVRELSVRLSGSAEVFSRFRGSVKEEGEGTRAAALGRAAWFCRPHHCPHRGRCRRPRPRGGGRGGAGTPCSSLAPMTGRCHLISASVPSAESAGTHHGWAAPTTDGADRIDRQKRLSFWKLTDIQKMLGHFRGLRFPMVTMPSR